jgi:hypothetical protein
MARIPLPPLQTPMFGALNGTFRQLAATLYPAKSPQWSEWYDAVTKLLNNFFVDGWITSDDIADDAITTTKIAENAIATPHLQANAVVADKIAANAITADKIQVGAVTADKISVTSLDAISINAGTITAGTFIGTTFKTAVSGARLELNNTGLTSYNASNAVVTQIATASGYVTTTIVQGNSGTSGGDLLLRDGNNLQQRILIDGASPGGTIDFLTANTVRAVLRDTLFELIGTMDFKVQNGRGLVFGSTAAISGSSSGTDTVEVYTASTLRLEVDETTGATQTPLLLQGDGALRRIEIDNADLGTGARRYLYLA